MRLVVVTLAALILTACSNRAVYEGVQAANRFECAKLPSSQYEECMENANRSYDEYQNARKR